MSQITQMELNMLKELIAVEDLNAKKFNLYANNCVDSGLSRFFNEQSLAASGNAHTLMSFLH